MAKIPTSDRRCVVCTHPKHEQIDKALIESRGSGAEIARRYGVASSNLSRHLARHIRPQVLAAINDRESKLRDMLVEHVENLSARIDRLQRVTDEVLQEAHVDGYPVFDKDTGLPKLDKDGNPLRRKSPKMALWAVGESRKNIDTSLKAVESIAKLTGKMQPEAAAPVSFTFEHLQVLYLGLKEKGVIV